MSFGLVAPIASFASLDEVVRRANNTEYGLVAYVFGKHAGQAVPIAEQPRDGPRGAGDLSRAQAHSDPPRRWGWLASTSHKAAP